MEKNTIFKSWSWALLLLVVSLFLLASSWFEHKMRQQLRQEFATGLESVVSAERKGLHAWYRQQQALAQLLANAPSLRYFFHQCQTACSAQPPELEAWMQSVFPDVYFDYALLSPGGKLLYSSVPIAEHPFAQDASLLKSLQTGELRFSAVLPLKLASGQEIPSIFLALPISSPEADTERHEGILALRLNPKTLYSASRSGAFFGQSGETYLVDAQGTMLTPSRFESELQAQQLLPPDQSSALHLRVREPAAKASDLSMQPYRDYRGVPVVGAWSWEAQSGLGIATEMDANEAFSGVQRALWRYYLFIGFSLSLLILLGYLLWKNQQNLLRRIQSLQRRESHYYQIFEQAPDAMVILNAHSIHYCNRKSTQFWEAPRSDIVGRSWLHFSPLNQPNGGSSSLCWQAYCERAQQGEILRFDWRFESWNGEQMSADVQLKALTTHEKQYLQVTIRERQPELCQ